MFADELLLFARADLSSVTKFMAAFQKFSSPPGLEASVDKSSMYIARYLVLLL